MFYNSRKGQQMFMAVFVVYIWAVCIVVFLWGELNVRIWSSAAVLITGRRGWRV